MNYLSIDYMIVYAFLIITAIIGFQAGKGINSIKDYAIGNKVYSVAVLVFTFIATNIGGGSTLDAASNTFSDGIIETIAALGVVIQILIFTIFITPHMHHFSHCLTIGDVMGEMYGKFSKIITGVLGTIYSFCMIGMELLVFGIISESLLGIPKNWGIIGGGILLAAYSAHGGIKAVTATDVFQFLILFIIIPVIAVIVFQKVGGVGEIFHRAPIEKFKIFSHEKFSFYFTLFLIWSVLPLGLISPPIFQRLLMANNPKDLRNQYLIVAGLDPLIRITVMLIGLGGLILYPYIQPSEVMPHIIKELLPVGIKGIAIAGMIAVVMSTVDSYLHTAGLLLVHDVIKPLSDSFKLITPSNEVSWSRYITLVVAAVSIVVGINSTDVLNLSFTAMRIAGPVLLFPLLAGIMGLKPDKSAFYGAMLGTVVAFIIFTLCLPSSYRHLGMPMSIIVNALVFIIVHSVVNKGIKLVKR